jgi:hypothetical protein
MLCGPSGIVCYLKQPHRSVGTYCYQCQCYSLREIATEDIHTCTRHTHTHTLWASYSRFNKEISKATHSVWFEWWFYVSQNCITAWICTIEKTLGLKNLFITLAKQVESWYSVMKFVVILHENHEYVLNLHCFWLQFLSVVSGPRPHGPDMERNCYESLLIVLDTLEKCLSNQPKDTARFDEAMNVKFLLREICQFIG